MATVNNPFLQSLLGDLANIGITQPSGGGTPSYDPNTPSPTPTPGPGGALPPRSRTTPTPNAEQRKINEVGGVGKIKGPSFAGDYNADIVPAGFTSLLAYGQPGYFFNPDTGEVGLIKATDAGASTFSTLSVAEAKRFLSRIDAGTPNANLLQRTTGSGPGAPSGADSFDSGGAGGKDPNVLTAAQRNTDANAKATLAETIRKNRVTEVQNAMDAIAARAENANKARLDAAQYQIDPNATSFPGFGPNDPLVRNGLASVVRPIPVQFNANAGNDAVHSSQLQQDLARIRQLAG